MPAPHRRRGPRGVFLGLAAAVLAASSAGCAPGRLTDGAYVNTASGFRVPAPPAPWTPTSLPDVEMAFRHPGTGTIAVFSECGMSERSPLRILARRLFFGLKGQRIVEQGPVSLDGAQALRTVVRGEMEGTPVIVDSVVVRRGGCVYDLVLAAPPEAYPALRPDLDRMAAGWAPLP